MPKNSGTRVPTALKDSFNGTAPTNPFANDPDRLLTVEDLTAIGVMAVGTARNLVSAGVFPFPLVRIGSNIRFRLGDVREFIGSQRMPSPGPSGPRGPPGGGESVPCRTSAVS
jgi:hypothetical protein